MKEGKTMQTMEQRRAKYAWDKAKGQSKDYRNLVKSAPAMIMTNGLMQTLAFLQGKGKSHHKDLLAHITGWLHHGDVGILEATGFAAVMTELSNMNSDHYQRATEEAMAMLRWLRHLADAACSDGEDGHGR